MRKILLLSLVSMLLLVVFLSGCGGNFAGKAVEFGNVTNTTNATTTNATTCTNDCTPSGQLACSGDFRLRTCGNYDADSCMEWNTGTWCDYGCANGACKAAPVNTTNATTCTNDCSSGQTTCSDNYAKTCGNYDADSCLEYDTGTACTYGCSGGTCLSAPANTTNQTNASATTGTIYATSIPTGAKVFVDGIDRGTTPSSIIIFFPGNKEVAFIKAGYRIIVRSVTVNAGETLNVAVNMTRI